MKILSINPTVSFARKRGRGEYRPVNPETPVNNPATRISQAQVDAMKATLGIVVDIKNPIIKYEDGKFSVSSQDIDDSEQTKQRTAKVIRGTKDNPKIIEIYEDGKPKETWRFDSDDDSKKQTVLVQNERFSLHRYDKDGICRKITYNHDGQSVSIGRTGKKNLYTEICLQDDKYPQGAILKRHISWKNFYMGYWPINSYAKERDLKRSLVKLKDIIAQEEYKQIFGSDKEINTQLNDAIKYLNCCMGE